MLRSNNTRGKYIYYFKMGVVALCKFLLKKAARLRVTEINLINCRISVELKIIKWIVAGCKSHL